MTSMENRFMTEYLNDNYQLQQILLNIAKENYETFDEMQKSNAAYWIGKLTYSDLIYDAKNFLCQEFKRLKPLVKADNSQSLENRYWQYLFRSVCIGLISYGKTDVLDEYLCLVVTNDIANAINRGATLEYLGEHYKESLHNDIYLDDNPNIGEHSIRVLCSRLESVLQEKKRGFVENDLIALLTIVQARMHVTPEKLSFNLMPICEKCLDLLQKYHVRPCNIVSDKLLFYFDSVQEDLLIYVKNPRFDAAFNLFVELSEMRNVKRQQWLSFGIDDPESVLEHTMSALMLAMIFLPQEYSEEGYNKQEILDMLLVHDMAQAILGNAETDAFSVTNALNEQNAILRKMFLKGTYPEVANLTRYYNVWTGFFNGKNINARIAKDINLIQTVNTFFACFEKHPEQFDTSTVKDALKQADNIITDIGYDLFERIISHNPIYRKSVDKKFSKQLNNHE